MTNDFVGFEIMMAPYIISNLRAKIALDNSNIEANDTASEMFQGKIYLYDTLADSKNLEETNQMDTLQIEEKNALIERNRNCTGEINKSIIEVIIGNPPYSGSSTNKSEWITDLLEEDLKDFKSYYISDRKISSIAKKQVQNDYVKFIRFAQCKVRNSGKGIVAMITPNSFLCDDSYSGMRESLLGTFDEIYIIDLNGDARMKAKECEKDENVFYIKTGVAVFFFVKTGKEKSGNAEVYYMSICNTRKAKLEELKAKTLQTMLKEKSLEKIDPIKMSMGTRKYCLKRLEVVDEEKIKKYEKWLSLDTIFVEKRAGLITGKDSHLIGFSLKDLKKSLHEFLEMSENEAIKERYEMDTQKDSRYKKIAYRPFDDRYVYYAPYAIERPVFYIMKHMLKEGEQNIGLIFTKNAEKSLGKINAFVTDKLLEFHFLSNSGSYLAPLFLYPDGSDQIMSFDISDMHNFNFEFLQTLLEKYSLQGLNENEKYDFIKDVFYYIYAILYSNEFTSTYRDILKFDFPRIPFVSNYLAFKAIADKGKELVETHLLSDDKVKFLSEKYKNKIFYDGSKNEATLVNNMEYNAKTKILTLDVSNKKERFIGIELEVWEFYIGFINPLKNYLEKFRVRKQKLNLENKKEFLKIAWALTYTVELQKDIDLLYKGYQVEQNAIDFSTILSSDNNVINYSKKNESQYSLLFKLAEIARNKNNASVYSRQTESQRNLLSRLAEIARQEKYYSNKSSLLRSLLRVTKRSFRDY